MMGNINESRVQMTCFKELLLLMKVTEIHLKEALSDGFKDKGKSLGSWEYKTLTSKGVGL